MLNDKIIKYVLIAAVVVLAIWLGSKLFKKATQQAALDRLATKPNRSTLTNDERKLISEEIHDSTKGFGTDELSLFNVLRMIPNKKEFQEVNAVHKATYNIDILDLLQSELDSSELSQATNIINKLR